jgi:hypothetical protein
VDQYLVRAPRHLELFLLALIVVSVRRPRRRTTSLLQHYHRSNSIRTSQLYARKNLGHRDERMTVVPVVLFHWHRIIAAAAAAAAAAAVADLLQVLLLPASRNV